MCVDLRFSIVTPYFYVHVWGILLVDVHWRFKICRFLHLQQSFPDAPSRYDGFPRAVPRRVIRRIDRETPLSELHLGIVSSRTCQVVPCCSCCTNARRAKEGSREVATIATTIQLARSKEDYERLGASTRTRVPWETKVSPPSQASQGRFRGDHCAASMFSPRAEVILHVLDRGSGRKLTTKVARFVHVQRRLSCARGQDGAARSRPVVEVRPPKELARFCIKGVSRDLRGRG